MAYAFASASSQNLTVSSAILSSYPISLAAWTRVENTTTNYRNIGIINSDASVRIVLMNCVSGGLHQVSSVPTSSGFSNTGAYSAGTFYHAAGVWPATNSRTPYFNGSAGTTNTDSWSGGSVDRFAIGGYVTAFLEGRNAEVAIWSVSLTGAEISSLSKGFKPYRIRPQSLVFYAPLIRNLQDTKGALAITNNNSAPVANHPRVY